MSWASLWQSVNMLKMLEVHAMWSSAGKHLLHYLSYELSWILLFLHGIEKQSMVATIMLAFGPGYLADIFSGLNDVGQLL